jgi:carboxymethylenebutenolidase
MHTRIELSAEGVSFFADVYLPSGDGRRGAVVVVHEWHGLNDGVRVLGKRFASEGMIAIVPDLYGGQLAKDDAEAGALMQAMKTGHSLAIFGACQKWVRGHARSNGEVAITGFCMGGAMAFAAATSLPGLSAAVPFYGVPAARFFEPSKVGCPIQAHFARHDDWARADKAEAFQRGVEAAGGTMELHVYDAGHAFMREGDAAAYDPEAAKLAWSRTIAFLRKRLG